MATGNWLHRGSTEPITKFIQDKGIRDSTYWRQNREHRRGDTRMNSGVGPDLELAVWIRGFLFFF